MKVLKILAFLITWRAEKIYALWTIWKLGAFFLQKAYNFLTHLYIFLKIKSVFNGHSQSKCNQDTKDFFVENVDFDHTSLTPPALFTCVSANFYCCL